MFGGVTYLNLDPKNRLAMPAKYRELLQDLAAGRMVITLESAQYLLLYSEPEWLRVRNKIQNLPNSLHPLVKSYQRLVLGYAETLELDKAGRLLVPATLKQLVNLEKEVVLVGMGNKFEVWDKAHWHQETEQALKSSATDLAQLLNGLNL